MLLSFSGCKCRDFFGLSKFSGTFFAIFVHFFRSHTTSPCARSRTNHWLTDRNHQISYPAQNLPQKTNKDPVYKKFGERFLSRLRKRSGPTGRIHEKRGENVRNRPALYERSLYVIREQKQKLPENRGSDKAQRIGPHPNTTRSYRSAETCPFPNRQTGISRRIRRRRGRPTQKL